MRYATSIMFVDNQGGSNSAQALASLKDQIGSNSGYKRGVRICVVACARSPALLANFRPTASSPHRTTVNQMLDVSRAITNASKRGWPTVSLDANFASFASPFPPADTVSYRLSFWLQYAAIQPVRSWTTANALGWTPALSSLHVWEDIAGALFASVSTEFATAL